MYSNGVVPERVENFLLKWERIDFKKNNKLQMEMGGRGLLTEDKHVFNQLWGDLWDFPGKDKKLWLIEVAATIKCGKGSRDVKISGGNSLDR